MKGILLLFALVSVHGFSQTRFVVNYSQHTYSGKQIISALERELPDTYDRHVNEGFLEFSAAKNYELDFIQSILLENGIQNSTVVKEKCAPIASIKVGGNNCEQAMQLCSNSSVPGNSGGAGIQELTNTNSGCLGVEHQSSWYYINVLTPGQIIMRINPDDNDDDYDFAIWGPFTAANAGVNCPPVSGPTRCSYSAEDGNTGMNYGYNDTSEDDEGNAWIAPLSVLTGQVYILLVDNYSTSNDGYNIQFNFSGNFSTATLGCTPVVLPVGLSEFKGRKLNESNLLSWTTESEINNSHFTLEWSSTGMETEWYTVSIVNGNGTAEDKHYYSAVHSDYRKNALNYYRLRQTDYDGYSTVFEQYVLIDNTIQSKEIVSITNLLGQEVEADEKGIVIIRYQDGSQEKRFNLD